MPTNPYGRKLKPLTKPKTRSVPFKMYEQPRLSYPTQAQLDKLPMPPARFLVSYWYFKDIPIDGYLNFYTRPPHPTMFADSGAYSAYNRKTVISVQEYAEWLHKWKHLFAVYANLDVKGSVEGGLKNLKYLEDQGLKPIPVFHGGEPLSVLEDFIASGYKYIALGGIAGGTANNTKLMRWMVKCFQMAEGKAVFHGFGMTRWDLMRMFPWYSVDSSSWMSGLMYGTASIFDESKKEYIRISVGKAKEIYQRAELIRSYGFNPKVFADRNLYHMGYAGGISGMGVRRAERWLRQVRGEVKIPGDETAEPGILMYIASARIPLLSYAHNSWVSFHTEGRANPYWLDDPRHYLVEY